MACSKQSQETYRILLIGRTGHGKSSTGNTILGYDAFVSSGGSKSCTKQCMMRESKGERFGKKIEVVDTPGFFDTDDCHTNGSVLNELLRIVLQTVPGFHVIAFVLKPDKFTPEIQKTLETFYKWFGKGLGKHTCLILTQTSTKEEMDEFIRNDPHEKLVELLQKCQNRVVHFENKGPTELKEVQVQDFLECVEKIQAKNNCFSNIVFQLAKVFAENNGFIGNFTKPFRLVKAFVDNKCPWSLQYAHDVLSALPKAIADKPKESDEVPESESGRQSPVSDSDVNNSSDADSGNEQSVLVSKRVQFFEQGKANLGRSTLPRQEACANESRNVPSARGQSGRSISNESSPPQQLGKKFSDIQEGLVKRAVQNYPKHNQTDTPSTVTDKCETGRQLPEKRIPKKEACANESNNVPSAHGHRRIGSDKFISNESSSPQQMRNRFSNIREDQANSFVQNDAKLNPIYTPPTVTDECKTKFQPPEERIPMKEAYANDRQLPEKRFQTNTYVHQEQTIHINVTSHQEKPKADAEDPYKKCRREANNNDGLLTRFGKWIKRAVSSIVNFFG